MEERLESEIEYFYRIERFIASMSDMEKLLEVIIREGRAATDAESCSLALYDEGSDELYFYTAMGEGGEGEVERRLKCIRMKMDAGIIGWTAVNMRPANIKDVYNDPRFYRQADEETGFVTRSILAVPMVRAGWGGVRDVGGSGRGRLIGVVEAVNKRNEEGFSERDEKVLTVLAAQAALMIDNARLHEENVRQARLSALGQGIAGSAHCIKNVLQGIDGGSYILDLGIRRETMESVSKGWDIMKRNVQFMRELVLDMLAYARPQDLQFEPADVNEVCRNVAGLMIEMARQKNVDVLTELQPEMREVVLDPKAIYRCILNLVSNAVDACDKPEGVVRITTHLLEADDRVEISVSDNGCGINEENLRNIFQIFFTTKGSKGTGLGLAVTEKMISEHRGSITPESELGVGTKFTITLPMNASPVSV